MATSNYPRRQATLTSSNNDKNRPTRFNIQSSAMAESPSNNLTDHLTPSPSPSLANDRKDEKSAAIEALCEKCQVVFNHWYEIEDWHQNGQGPKHHTLTSLEASAQAGCPICFMFFGSLTFDEVLLIRSSDSPGESQVTIPLPAVDGACFVELAFPYALASATIRVVPTSCT